MIRDERYRINLGEGGQRERLFGENCFVCMSSSDRDKLQVTHAGLDLRNHAKS